MHSEVSWNAPEHPFPAQRIGHIYRVKQARDLQCKGLPVIEREPREGAMHVPAGAKVDLSPHSHL